MEVRGDDTEHDILGVGTVVRDRRGRPVHRDGGPPEGQSVIVAWHGSFLEDELHLYEVEVWADVPEELRDWREGIGVVGPDGAIDVEGVTALQRR